MLETGLKDVKNAMTSLFPKLKYSDQMIEDIKNMDLNKAEESEDRTKNEDNHIKEDSREEIKEKEEEKSIESGKEN